MRLLRLIGIDRRTPEQKATDAIRKQVADEEKKRLRIKSTVQPTHRNTLKVIR